MNSVILTKKQVCLIAEAIEKYKLDQIKIDLNNSNGIGPVMTIEVGNSEKIDITDVSNW